MKFTVVPPVKAAESAPSQPIEKLRPITRSDVPSRSTTIDIPLAETSYDSIFSVLIFKRRFRERCCKGGR